FIAELIVLLAYYHLWDRWEARHKQAHLALGIAYVLLACLSAGIISAILGFMLTPGEWPDEHRFWTAFLNPSYIPQFVVRLTASILLGALFVAVAVLHYRKEAMLRREALPLFVELVCISLPLHAVS